MRHSSVMEPGQRDGSSSDLQARASSVSESSSEHRSPSRLEKERGLATRGQPYKACFISPLGSGLYGRDEGSPYGGAELQCYLLSRELAADRDFRVSVLTTVASGPSREERDSVTIIRRQGKRRLVPGTRPTGRPLAGYCAAFWEMFRLLRAIDADVYLYAGAGVEVGAYAVICRLLRRRFVYVVASSADLQDSYEKVKGPLRGLFPMGIRMAHAVVCRTREQQSWLRTSYRRDGVLIPTGHPPADESTVEKTSLLWVGRAHPVKQPGMFLDLAERLEDHPCTMVVMGDREHEALRRTIRERAAALPNVTLHENVPRAGIAPLFQEAKLFINTSSHEGFPNTFVEAAMQSVPIVSWKVNPDSVLSTHRIGICAEGSFERLVASTQELCEIESRRREYGARARSYALAHHDVRRSAGLLKALLRVLVAPRARDRMEDR